MAWQLVDQRTFEPDTSSYRGPAEKLTAELKGPPEQVVPVSIARRIVEEFVLSTKGHGATPLKITVWADWSPTWETKYKVELVAHGSPAIPWQVIVLAIAAVLIVLGIAFIVWQVDHMSWGGAATIIVVAIAAAVGFFLWAGRKK